MALALQVALALLVALQAGASTLPEEAGILREEASIQEEASIPVAATTPTMWFTTTIKHADWVQLSILAAPLQSLSGFDLADCLVCAGFPRHFFCGLVWYTYDISLRRLKIDNNSV